MEGRKVLRNPDGTEKTDDHGNRIKFEEFVDSIADKYFEFYKADDKSAPNHKQSHTNSKSTVFNITSEQEFIELMKTATSETRPLILDAYNEAKSKGKF